VKALTFHGKENIQFESIPDPKVSVGGDAIVKVILTCICGSDLHVYHERERGMDHGTAMGHEFVGEVVEAGNDVKRFQVGDLVMSPFTTNCGECFYCRIGLTCRCERGELYGWVEKGNGLQGGQAEYVRVPMADSTLMKIPEGVSLEEGLLLGDIFSTGFYCAHQAGIKSNETQVIVGCGPVGIMAIFGARELGAGNLFAVDSVASRLQMAKELGATPIDFSKQNPREVIYEHTHGRGADAVMELVGNQAAGNLAYDLLRPGGTISAVGVCTDAHLSFSPTQAYDKNISYKVGRCPARYFMDQLIPIVQQKKYPIAKIFSHRMKLEEGKRGYDIFANRKDDCMKVVMEV
jgi:threonine dehydrogenase-like Zn-dependent dehydrogenase